MKALTYYPSIPRFLAARALGKRFPSSWAPLRLVELPEPEPPPGWVRARVRLAGICGSDLALLFGKNSPRLSPFFSFPAVLGHEILAELEGSRVAVNPLLACAERGLEPCPACARGEEGLCQNVAEGSLAAGMLGYNRDLPGGWGGWIVAQPERLHLIPDGVPDQRAVLAEPLAVALRGLRRAFAKGDGYGFPGSVLIIGAGTIGLLSLALLRALGYRGRLDVVARHRMQADLARKLGASGVFASSRNALENIGAKEYKPILGPPVYRGGYEAVIEAAGSPSSLEAASWATREGGTVLLLGAAGEVRHDFSPHWFSELTWKGSYTYGRADFAYAVGMLPELNGLEELVAPPFSLPAWRHALAAIRQRRVVKAVFTPSNP
ncbi:zinc-dependent alcohol dehydrogenase [Oceanithermus sp.]